MSIMRMTGVLTCAAISAVAIGGFLSLSRAADTAPDSQVLAAGERLVHNLDCHVCHSPKIMTDKKPQPDTARLLSGHPAAEELPPIPADLFEQGRWGGLFSPGMTAWVGSWGVSYASNLTPDPKTGIGNWTEAIFVGTMRSGIHVSAGRPFLPPMPTYAQLNDEELHAIYVYLRSLPPIVNEAPESRPSAPPAR